MLYLQRKGWVYWAAQIPVGKMENSWDTDFHQTLKHSIGGNLCQVPKWIQVASLSLFITSCMTHTITQFSLIGTQPIPQLLVVKLAPLKQGQLEACGCWALLQLLFPGYVARLGYSLLPSSSGTLGSPGSQSPCSAFDPSSCHTCTAAHLLWTSSASSIQHLEPREMERGLALPPKIQVAEGEGWRRKPSAPLLSLGCTSLCLPSNFPGETASAGGCFSALLFMLLPRAARLITVDGLFQLWGKLYLLQCPSRLRGLSHPPARWGWGTPWPFLSVMTGRGTSPVKLSWLSSFLVWSEFSCKDKDRPWRSCS